MWVGMFRKVELVVDNDFVSLKNFLRSKAISTATIRKLKRIDNGILLNGISVFTNVPVKKNDLVELNLIDETVVNSEEFNYDLDILYQDDDYLLINKPHNLAVHPTSTIKNKTLKNAFDTYCNKNNFNYIFRPIYRLDKNTSGIITIAKNRLAVSMTDNVVKKYIAICHGATEKQGVINAKIALQENSFIKRIVDDVGGKQAITHYKTLYSNNEYSIVELELETGRTHQIRVHMSSIGHPLVGDDLYGGSRDLLNRQALHCYYIKFTNKLNGDIVECNCEIPSDMEIFIEKYLSGFRSENIVC